MPVFFFTSEAVGKNNNRLKIPLVVVLPRLILNVLYPITQ
jgi:hypothetical protein